jgi:hypothetical protein
MSLLFNIIVMLLNFRIIIDTRAFSLLLFPPSYSRSLSRSLFTLTMAFQLHTQTACVCSVFWMCTFNNGKKQLKNFFKTNFMCEYFLLQF